MEARALTRHEKASLKSFLSGVYAGVICLHVTIRLAFVTWVTTSHAWSRLLSAGPRGALCLGSSADPLVSVAWKSEKD